MKGLFQFRDMLKKAQEMQEQMKQELAEMRIEGSSGGGMVQVVLDGAKNLCSLTIDPELVKSGDRDMLQDLIMAAFHDAGRRADKEMSKKLGRLKIPGLTDV